MALLYMCDYSYRLRDERAAAESAQDAALQVIKHSITSLDQAACTSCCYGDAHSQALGVTSCWCEVATVNYCALVCYTC
jgi:hypothetical protein